MAIHHTNTCDPYTGNWEEQLMNPYHLTRVLKGQGFDAKVLSGFYFIKKRNTLDKKILSEFLNAIIKGLRTNGIAVPLSAFYIVFGEKIEATMPKPD